jgi:hypothetical protein
VRNTRDVATSWTASGSSITPGFDVDVSPSSFTFSGGLGETQELTIIATPNTNLTAVAFGEVVLHEAGGISPDERITVAIKGSGGGGGCPPTITHSTSQTIVQFNSASCNNGPPNFNHTDNSYWRAFDMNTFTGGQQYDVTDVSFGVEQATSASGTGQPVTVNLYTNSGAPFPDGTLTLLASTGSINVPDQALTVFSTALTATVPAGTSELVMEVFTPDGQAVGNTFFVGSNALAETGPSYISAVECGILDPTPTAEIGFPDMHIVFNVDGSCPGGTPTPTPTATPTPTVPPRPTPGPSATPPGTPPPRP